MSAHVDASAAAPKQKKPRGKEIALDKPVERGLFGGWSTRYLDKALPFYNNERGLLTHRVRTVAEYIHDGKVHHRSVGFLCGNGTCIRAGGEFLAEPTRLLCSRCEFVARSQRKPIAEELTGRHCHIGRPRVEQACLRHRHCGDPRRRDVPDPLYDWDQVLTVIGALRQCAAKAFGPLPAEG